MSVAHPEEWVGLGFVGTVENADPATIDGMEGIASVAIQIAWGLNANHPVDMESYLDAFRRQNILPVGWAWCDAEDQAGARVEGLAHAQIAVDLGLRHFIANQEEEYDAHGTLSSPKYDMPKAYCEAFRSILPDVEFAITTLNRCGSNHQAMRDAGATLMPQCFFLEAHGATLDKACEHAKLWGWDMRYVRPLVQVYETNGEVPDPNVYLQESSKWGVGVIPYILEQAFSGAGRAALDALVPAITRQPSSASTPIPPTNGDDMIIGPDHGVAATYNRLRELDPKGCNFAFDPKKPFALPINELKAYDKWCRTMTILVEDHDANASV